MTDDEQLAIIRGLLERQAAKTDAIEAKVDAHRAEGERRGHEQSAGLEAVRVEVQRLNSRMAEAEHDIRELRDADGHVLRHQSEVDLEHAAAIGGAIAHTRTLDEKVIALDEKVGALTEASERNERANRAVFGELGLDYSSVTSDRPSASPNRPKTTLAKIATENKSSVAAGVVSTLLIIVQIVWKLLEHR